MDPPPVWLRTVCRQNGLLIGDAELRRMEQYVRLLLEWNKKINLISRKDEENIWHRHILHSLSILFKLKIPEDARVIDLGTGGGLPGIPLKIAQPEMAITLLDSTQKKILALREIVNALKLAGVETLWGRAEEIGRSREYRHRFDVVVARSVAPLKDLIRWSAPLLRTRDEETQPSTDVPRFGMKREIEPPFLIALKGGELERELAAARRMREPRAIGVLELTLKGTQHLELAEKKIAVVKF